MFVCTVHVNSFDTSRSKVDLDWSVATALRWIASVLVIAKSQMFWSRNSHRLAFDRSCDSIPPELLDCTAFQFLVGVVTGRVLEIGGFFSLQTFCVHLFPWNWVPCLKLDCTVCQFDRTPLHYAAKERHVDVTKILLERGKDLVTLKDKVKWVRGSVSESACYSVEVSYFENFRTLGWFWAKLTSTGRFLMCM